MIEARPGRDGRDGEGRGAAPVGRDRGRAGFGLIEAILALAIAGMVLAAVTELSGRTLRSWNRGFASMAAVERTDIALGRIARDLTRLLPIRLVTSDDPDVLFAGDSRGMAFTALTPFDRGSDGIAVVEIGIESTRDGTVLVRRLRRGRDSGLREGDRVVLLSGRLDLAFAYRDGNGRRTDRWARPGEVPQGVIVTLTGERGGGGLPVEVLLPIPVPISVSCLIELPETAAADPEVPEVQDPAGGPPAPGGPPAAPGAGAPDATAAASAGGQDRSRRCPVGPNGSAATPEAPATQGEGGG